MSRDPLEDDRPTRFSVLLHRGAKQVQNYKGYESDRHLHFAVVPVVELAQVFLQIQLFLLDPK
ncbi:MAG: hypothetical protein ACK45T_21980, partial [Pseudanabaena sp.]